MRILLIKKDKIKNNSYELSKKEENYLKNVLRLADGESFKAKDEKENIYGAVLNGCILTLTEDDEIDYLDFMPSFTGHFQRIHLYQAILKGKKNERVVRDVQEAGVERTTFISTEFTSSSEIKKHDMERLEAIRREALILHQSTRGKTKSIIEALKDVEKDDVISVFIGSEGGFSDHECEKAEERNAIPILLKTNILRAENASIYTISAVQTLLNE